MLPSLSRPHILWSDESLEMTVPGCSSGSPRPPVSAAFSAHRCLPLATPSLAVDIVSRRCLSATHLPRPTKCDRTSSDALGCALGKRWEDSRGVLDAHLGCDMARVLLGQLARGRAICQAGEIAKWVLVASVVDDVTNKSSRPASGGVEPVAIVRIVVVD